MNTPTPPAELLPEHLEYLNAMRKAGTYNMGLAGLLLLEEFPELGRKTARAIGMYWMLTFRERTNA